MWLQFRRSYCLGGGVGGGALTAASLGTDRSEHKRGGRSSWISIRDRVLTDRHTFLV